MEAQLQKRKRILKTVTIMGHMIAVKIGIIKRSKMIAVGVRKMLGTRV